jgi:hypothetical protein
MPKHARNTDRGSTQRCTATGEVSRRVRKAAVENGGESMNTAIFALGLILFVSGIVGMVYSVEKVVVNPIYNPSDAPYGFVPIVTTHTEMVHPYLMEGVILLVCGVVIGGLGIYLVPRDRSIRVSAVQMFQQEKIPT